MNAPEWLQALVLGLVQGATEFLPVSSSAHLVLVPEFLGWQRPGLAFDVALHAGTALAIVLYYRRDLWAMAVAVLGRGDPDDCVRERRLVVYLAVASVPVAVAGLLLRGLVEDSFEEPRVAATMLLVTALMLVLGERWRARRVAAAGRSPRTEADPEGAEPDAPLEAADDPTDPAGRGIAAMRLRDAIVVGIGQALALVPGLSRSGTTITAGMVAGLTRPAATRFAFLLALPAIVGATIVSVPDLTGAEGVGAVELTVGIAAAFVSGYAAIAALVRLVARAGLAVFAGYLVIAAVLSWIVILT